MEEKRREAHVEDNNAQRSEGEQHRICVCLSDYPRDRSREMQKKKEGKYTKCAMTLAQVKPIRSNQTHSFAIAQSAQHSISNYF